MKKAVNPVFGALGHSLLATAQLDAQPHVRDMWTNSLVIANSLIVVFVLAGGIVVMSHGSVQSRYAVKDVAPRLVVAVVAANLSLFLCGKAISMANGLSAALLGPGVDPQAAGKHLATTLTQAVGGPASFGLLMNLLLVWGVLLGLVLIFIYIVRIVLTAILIAAAPLALICHALPQTEGLAKLWWRAYGGVLAIQVAQALVVVAAMRLAFTSDITPIVDLHAPASWVRLWTVEALLYILVRIPSWITRQIWRGGLSASPLIRGAKTLAAILIFRGLSGGRAGAAGARTRTQPPPPPPPPPREQQWIQDELPFDWPTPPPPKGEQLDLPLDVPGHPGPRPQPPRPSWTQLPLPTQTSRPAYWHQPPLFRPRYAQTRLPDPPPRPVQEELPLQFPERGSPAAGRSPHRIAEAQALRDAQARARLRAQPPPPPPTWPPRRLPRQPWWPPPPRR